MHIKEVTYTLLRSFGSGNNHRVGCTVVVNEGEDADAAFAHAKSFVKHNMQRVSEEGIKESKRFKKPTDEPASTGETPT
jgi:hypothetical protein